MTSSVVSDNFETSTGGLPTLGGDSVETRLCSAWVNFNGTGTVAIRDSYNVSSITDNGDGDYTVNFTVAMANNNYAATVAGGGSSAYLGDVKTDSTTYTRTISALPILTFNTTPATADVTSINVTVFGGK